MKRRALALLLLVVAFAAAWWLARTRARVSVSAASELRIVSLSPAITETVFALGRGSALVGVSDYCNRPPAATTLPRVGTGLTPNYEEITRLGPTLILAEQNASTRRQSLDRLANTVLLPWLSVDEMTSSIRRIGQLTASAREADALAARLYAVLAAPAPTDAPRVLLVLGYEPGHLTEVWYIKDDSLHGGVLRAAGGRNAVSRHNVGPPRLSLTEVIALDPDMIVILAPDAKTPANRWLDDWHALSPLRAINQGRISVLRSPTAFGDGPSVVDLVPELRAEIARLSALPSR